MLILLGIVFLMLKSAGVISWAWWIVLIPFYPVLAVIALAAVTVTGGVLVTIGSSIVNSMVKR